MSDDLPQKSTLAPFPEPETQEGFLVPEDDAKVLLESLIHLLPGFPDHLVRLTKETIDGEWAIRTGEAIAEDADFVSGGASYAPGVGAGMSDGEILQEVEILVKSVSEVRRVYMPNGKPRPDVSPRDVVSLQSSAMGALEKLVKFRDNIINQSRLNALQRAVIRGLEREDPSIVQRVLGFMREELEKVN